MSQGIPRAPWGDRAVSETLGLLILVVVVLLVAGMIGLFVLTGP